MSSKPSTIPVKNSYLVRVQTRAHKKDSNQLIICKGVKTILLPRRMLNNVVALSMFPSMTLSLEQSRLAGCILREGADWL